MGADSKYNKTANLLEIYLLENDNCGSNYTVSILPDDATNTGFPNNYFENARKKGCNEHFMNFFVNVGLGDNVSFSRGGRLYRKIGMFCGGNIGRG